MSDLPRSAIVGELLESMTIEEKVGQMIAPRAEGVYMSEDSRRVRELLGFATEAHVGGFTFFQANPLEQVHLINRLQRASKIPLLISQDFEYGPGMRIPEATTFPTMMAVGATRRPELARLVGQITAREARALGVHQVFAPVADVNNNPANPIVNTRAFGEDPEVVAEMVTQLVKGLQEEGTIATVKHFPGHGDTSVDSHADLPVLDIDRDRLEQLELIPFRRAIQEGVRSVMVGHLALPSLERGDVRPATLSIEITSNLLRDELGFGGLIVTDAMDMDGVCRMYGSGESAVLAVEAGADMLTTPKDVWKAVEALVDGVKSGRISEDRLDESVARILAEKERLGLFASSLVDLDEVGRYVSIHAHIGAAEEVAASSLTLLRNETAVPVSRDSDRIAVVFVSDTGRPQGDPFFAAMQELAGNRQLTRIDPLGSDGRPPEPEMVSAIAKEHDLVIVGAFVRVRAWSGQISLSPHNKELIERIVASGTPVVLVSFGSPYLISGIVQPDAYIVAYSDSPASQRATAEALFGAKGFPGRLPVTIDGHYERGAGIG